MIQNPDYTRYTSLTQLDINPFYAHKANVEQHNICDAHMCVCESQH